ncbi:peptidase M1 [Caulobacter sp. Root655]|uniref:M1 family metallopeptidase n=1 Tax=Caulobacter sp. Root655 TaxID=1736578 RepID=UPI0006F4C1F0|nr:M1 family metallopeptidase [Caulobacter sp. Root655]KRA59210.1 peptidase M1 [Caulobacter sp. Root655]
MIRVSILALAGSLLAAPLALAQTAAPVFPPNDYAPLKTFAPLTLPAPASGVRNGAGAPGAGYWQNRADYRIDARLDPAAKTLSATVTITYANNSPDALGSLWLQLDQNVYRRDSRAGALGGRPRKEFTDGYAIEAVEVEQVGKTAAAPFLVDDTRMRVTLPAALKGGGGQVKLTIRYHYAVPGAFGGRTAWGPSDKGDIFDIAQWYPRMAVYDDVRGWDTLPYLANEFYLDYGSFDYAVTVPADMIVAGSGALTNPKDVLSAEQQARLAKARASDQTVLIRPPEEAVASSAATGTKTWRFHMDDTRDVAFTASKVFVWDAARINLPGGKTALAQSVYPVESVGEGAWSRSTEYLKHAVEQFSTRWYPYPYPNAINVAGPATGMEYPGIVFDGVDDKGKDLFWITAHEIGHTWFPMIVGFDERRDAWMDEGFNTFIDVYESDAFGGGVYGPKRDSEYAPGPGAPADQIAAILEDAAAPPILSRADTVREKYRHPITYFKSAFGLTLLREDILGPERFDPAFRKFIADWAFKHPKPSDFFRAMESAGGEDLSWFWRGWYLNNWTLDMDVAGIAQDADLAKGAKVTVENRGQLVLPATLRVMFQDGGHRDIRVPVETWMQSGSHVFAVDTTSPVVEAVIDPDHRTPDRDRTNNSLRGAPGA